MKKKNSGDIPKTKKPAKKIIPVAASTSGYCQDIFFLQYRHRPRKNKKLKTGIKSNALKSCLHLGQCERFLTILFRLGERKTTTFKKLPTADPKIKNKSEYKIVSIIKPLYNFILKNKSPPTKVGGNFCKVY